ncbi:MAG: cytochrome B, partial [Burkholderiaceae bacterium]
ADDEISNTGPLIKFVSSATSNSLTGWHKSFGQWLVIGLALLHVAAVLFYLWRRKNDLIRPMWTGDKLLPAAVPAALDRPRSRVLALLVAAGCAALVTWIVKLGG